MAPPEGELFVACRQDPDGSGSRIYLTEESTWTRNEALARRADRQEMMNVLRRIQHAYPGLFLEKIAADPPPGSRPES